jgi:hypothetical protein
MRESPAVDVLCAICRLSFDISSRSEQDHRHGGVALVCRRCRGNAGPSEVEIEKAKRWWLSKFTVDELRACLRSDVHIERLEDVVGKPSRFERLAAEAHMTRSQYVDYLAAEILKKLDALDAVPKSVPASGDLSTPDSPKNALGSESTT